MSDVAEPPPAGTMVGAQALLTSLADAGVEVCFMNPGTSEMHFVHALDAVPQMRSVLALFEGVATGAADGYARIAGRPAAVLLHLGPGLGNGYANLHNARRAHSPVLCIVGGHATDHVRLDAPLQSDIEGVARTVAGWVHTPGTPAVLAADAMRGLQATGLDGGQVATLVLPADVSWSDGATPAAAREPVRDSPVAQQTLATARTALTDGAPALLLLGGPALSERGLRAASRLAGVTGVRLLAETFPARLEAGAGVPAVLRLAYPPEQADEQLAGLAHLVLAGAASPVTFFGYPGRAGDLVPAGCTSTILGAAGEDVVTALEALADGLAPGSEPVLAAAGTPEMGTGALTVRTLAPVVAASLPEHAIVVDESATSGGGLPTALAGAARHSVLTLTGGAIGQGLTTAVGAAVAAPDRPVLAVQADGGAMYTIQALWTMAREQLDVTVLLVNNAAYAVLRLELNRVGAGHPGERAARMLDLSEPTADFVALAHGFGVPAVRATTVEELDAALRQAYAEAGPHLIEAIVPPVA